jgi:L-ribulose-5-phosphate 3-epimerase
MRRNRIGIMQGRLLPRYNGRYQSFPPENWRNEFTIAESMGFDCIEFIYDYENYEESPLITENGIKEIQDISRITGVKILSVCADFFMTNALFDSDDKKRGNNVFHLERLITQSSKVGVKDITVPFVDDSSMTDKESLEAAQKSLRQILPAAEHHGISINLETDLPPPAFCQFIKGLNHPMIKVNYDIGNSASLGYDPEEELAAYGEFISVLHVKDRVRGGGSVRLGTGDANFEAVFRNLNKLDFGGIIIMQAARATEYSDERKLIEEQLAFLKECLDRWFN